MKTLFFILLYIFIVGANNYLFPQDTPSDNLPTSKITVPARIVENGIISIFEKFSDGSDRDFYPVEIDGEIWDFPLLTRVYRLHTYTYYPEYTPNLNSPFNPREYDPHTKFRTQDTFKSSEK